MELLWRLKAIHMKASRVPVPSSSVHSTHIRRLVCFLTPHLSPLRSLARQLVRRALCFGEYLKTDLNAICFSVHLVGKGNLWSGKLYRCMLTNNKWVARKTQQPLLLLFVLHHKVHVWACVARLNCLTIFLCWIDAAAVAVAFVLHALNASCLFSPRNKWNAYFVVEQTRSVVFELGSRIFRHGNHTLR